jgi:pSer/pThr/pTyr-binding forkhead associated (FHA) protein
MRVTLQVQNGSAAGKQVVITPGQAVKVGRLDKADFVLPEDPLLSNVHFVLECTADACRLRDLESRFGTFVNKRRVTDVLLRAGDQIQAGRTAFLVAMDVAPSAEPPPAGAAPAADRPPPRPATLVNLDLDAQPAPAVPQPAHRPTLVDFDLDADLAPAPPVPRPAAPALSPLHTRVLDTLRSEKEPLFALLDAARDDLVYARLLHCGEEHQSLYEGPKGEALAEVGPFLVRVPRNSPFLETLVREGWGQSWGVYLTCALPFKEVRRHLRHFLLARVPGGKEVYFRFYDPRVLRIYLPTCRPEELRQFFGPIHAFLMESQDPGLCLRYTPELHRADPRSVMLALRA